MRGIVTTEGDTMEEALATLREAVELYLAEELTPLSAAHLFAAL
jgi:predicted RNase H-like HicB family nuclease